MKEIQRLMKDYRGEIEWKQMEPTVVMIEHLNKWIGLIENLLDDSRERFENRLKEKREEYERIVGKKPFMGWGLAAVDSKLEERKMNVIENEAYKKSLSDKPGKCNQAKMAIVVEKKEKKINLTPLKSKLPKKWTRDQ